MSTTSDSKILKDTVSDFIRDIPVRVGHTSLNRFNHPQVVTLKINRKASKRLLFKLPLGACVSFSLNGGILKVSSSKHEQFSQKH